jgi:selenocysteine-specific elongation factor
VATLGGGVVLFPDDAKIKPRDAEALSQLERLASSDERERAGAAAYFAGLSGWRPADAPRTAGISDPQAADKALRDSGEVREISISPTRSLRVHCLALERLCGRMETALAKLHDAEPLQSTIEQSRLLSRFAYVGDEAVVRAALSEMERSGRVRLLPGRVGLAGRGPKLTKSEQRLLEEMVAHYAAAGLAPPTVKEAQQQAGRLGEAVPQLLALAEAEGRLVKISPEFYLHIESERELRRRIGEALANNASKTMSELREALGASRKYAVPFCEHLDRAGVTRREGDLRRLA